MRGTMERRNTKSSWEESRRGERLTVVGRTDSRYFVIGRMRSALLTAITIATLLLGVTRAQHQGMYQSVSQNSNGTTLSLSYEEHSIQSDFLSFLELLIFYLLLIFY